ncbi:MAG TPA: spherulation-specific family 4 protein, partial [Giesbergeria sp.]|nr:spherulation-specific family 4 protein [Giesbergeria sp.]
MTPLPSTLRPWALPLLTTLLFGCGGGSSDSTTPTPTTQVQLQFSAPAEADNVQTLGVGIPVAVGVTVNGATAADGTSVVWSAANASFSPARSSSTGGQASSTMVATAGGMLQVQASATVSGQTSSATKTLYLRPAPQALEVLVPAYFNPNPSGSPWDQLISTAQAYPGVQVTAIMNPNDGIFSSADEQF